jgi:acyl carrier protein
MTLGTAELREHLVTAAKEVLQDDSLLASDNFFEQGGDSFTVIELCQRVEPLLGVEIPLELVWEADDFTTLAAELHRLAHQIA